MAAWLIYAPEGAEPKRWDMDSVKFMSPEALALEKATGLTVQELGELMVRGSFTATHAFLWILLRREIPGLRYEELEYDMAAIQSEVDDDETGDEPDPKELA